MILGVDFDGTIVKDAYPKIGDPVPGAIECLRELANRYGAEIWLYTCRQGQELWDAENYLRDNGIPHKVYDKLRANAYGTIKPFVDYFIDDRAIGTPLVMPDDDKPYVKWEDVMILLGYRTGNAYRLAQGKRNGEDTYISATIDSRPRK